MSRDALNPICSRGRRFLATLDLMITAVPIICPAASWTCELCHTVITAAESQLHAQLPSSSLTLRSESMTLREFDSSMHASPLIASTADVELMFTSVITPGRACVTSSSSTLTSDMESHKFTNMVDSCGSTTGMTAANPQKRRQVCSTSGYIAFFELMDLEQGEKGAENCSLRSHGVSSLTWKPRRLSILNVFS